MKRLDLINTPLSGTNLIEANAGTGKTYAIAGLFLRLILEKRFSVDQILVVTFTKAATEELKERVRNTLLQAKNAFSGDAGIDPFLKDLVKKQENPRAAIQLLRDALAAFDRAAIFTIHGFCQRILHENAFETGSLFDTELETDPVGLMQEVADDFWRKHFCTYPPEFIRYSNTEISGPEYFSNLLGKIRTPEIRIVPELKQPEFENLLPFRQTLNRLRDRWPESRETIRRLLTDAPLNGNIYGSLKDDPRRPGFTKRVLKVLAMVEAMDRIVDVKSTGVPLFKDFEKFTATKLNQSVKKNNDPPFHEIFEICDQINTASLALETEMERNILFLKAEFFKYAKRELSVRKQNLNIKFFDDLLKTVKNALAETGGNALSSAIRKRYRAALVDEFQDTDPVQYEIFSRIFDSDETVLFMIGDPKQAIYAFRGADIFSYMTAARQAAEKHTLSKNWRSGPGLITAVNTLFSNVKDPFVFDEILFEKSRPGKNAVSVGAASDAPMKIWFVGSKEDRPIPKSRAVEMIAAAVAGEIVQLVSPGADKIEAGDIAVLVRTNRQAQIVKDHLSAKKIPSVLYNTGNIFDSHEALEMQRVLSSVSEPGNERRLKSALATDMLGVSGETLYSSQNDFVWWESRLSDFREYFRLWTLRGFIRMFRLLMKKEKVKRRLLSFPDGERRLTNLLHLSEILHQKCIEKNLGVSGLLKWLSEQRNTVSPESEEHQLRLESDEEAVKIITIHKSKGLEYPVVFCPYGWEGSVLKQKEVLFHDVDAKERMTLDIGSTQIDRHLALAQNELLSENLRLLYVALTRAKSRCYLAWGRINTAETSAMAYLLFGGAISESFSQGIDKAKVDVVSALGKIFSAKDDDDLFSDTRRLADKAKGTIELLPLPPASDAILFRQKEKQEKRFCRIFSGRIDKTWNVSSYSALVSRRSRDAEHPDRDAFPQGGRGYPIHATDSFEPSAPGDAKPDIFSFPKGARAGIFFHDIFEHLDFTSNDIDYPESLVAEKLTSHGFDLSWKDIVCKTIKNVISTPLLMERNDLVLSSIGCGDRVNEMEFYFPLKSITPRKLKNIFFSYAGGEIPADYSGRLGKLVFSSSEGFMKGYIDMIFHEKGRYYLVDWKSNFLGSRIENYSRTALKKIMKDGDYILQYCLYTLALHLHLRQRVPNYRYETNFGGVLYVFIRGMAQRHGPESGIYSDLPEAKFIHALGDALVTGY